ncbi:MAG: hypothetical protein J6K39_02215 [Clostridia bacterium]|nr:hypothetical protein [Clostridia bacterium]
MDREYNKIVIISLCDNHTKLWAEKLSQTLGMIFCDTKDLIEYELIDKKAVEELCTKEYLEHAETRVLKHIASFTNVVVSINYDYLIHNFNILKEEGLVVFLKLPRNFIQENGSTVDAISYENRTKELEKLSNVTINLRKTDADFVCDKIIKTLGGIL